MRVEGSPEIFRDIATEVVPRPPLREPEPAPPSRAGSVARVAVPAVVFLVLLVARTHGITRHFWMLRDQIRDWQIALGPFTSLPLVGPATHVGGYTIGPAFYWVLWLVRVVVGPWFDNLPHAGGIGQALLDSAVDAWLLVAIWKRTASGWLAAAAALLIATSPDDFALSAVIWNPVMGAVFAKAALAAVLLRWPERSLPLAAATAALAWCGVHAYTGAIFAALGVFAAIVVPPLTERRPREALRRLGAVALVVALLQVPWAVYSLRHPGGRVMGAVSDSVMAVVTGGAGPQIGRSASFFALATGILQLKPWHAWWIGWLVLACGAVVLVRHRKDPALLAVTVLPPALAVAGYTFWLGDLGSYYYFSLMPAVVLTVLLAAMPPFGSRAAGIAGAAMLAVALAILPVRLQAAATIHKMPGYAVILRASREMARRGVPLRQIRADFLPPTANPEFLFRILGGRIVHGAEWYAVVSENGQVTYLQARD